MIKSIKAINFQSWAELDFNIQDGITLIQGFNHDDNTSEGSGKSACCNALTWGLYGKLPKEDNVKIDDILRDGQKSCGVEIEIEHPKYTTITRTRNPNQLFLTDLAGNHITGKDSRETQEMIESVIGLSFDAFLNSVYFAQNYNRKFLSTTSEEKAKIFSEIQDLQIFDVGGKKAFEMIKLEKTGLQNIQVQFDKLIAEIGFLGDKIETTKTRIIERQKQAALRKTELEANKRQSLMQVERQRKDRQDQLDRNLKRLEEQETYLNNKIKELHDANQQLELSIEGHEESTLTQEIKDLNDKLEVITTEKNTLQASLSSAEENNRLIIRQTQARDSYIKDIEKLGTKIQELEAFIANPTQVCPTCGTELKDVDTTHAQSELTKLNNQLIEVDNEIQRLNQKLEESKECDVAETKRQIFIKTTQIAELKKDITDKNKDLLKFKEIQAKIKLNDKQVIEYIAQVKKSQVDRTNLKAVDNSDLEVEISRIEADYTAKLAQISEIKVDDLEVVQAQLENELVTKDESAQALSALKVDKELYINRLETLRAGFKEVKSFVFNNALRELTHKANQIAAQLFEVPVKIIMKNDEGKIVSEVVLDGKVRSLGTLSGGQARRVGFAVDLALSDLVSSRKNSNIGNIKIFDETMKDLSESSMEKVIKLFESLKGSVILIEHNSIVKSIVDNTFEVELRNGVSRSV